jgi:phosphatidylserine/phosphatidylglycerophosphate/cardiolipin synthase-like enzyme
MLVAIVLVVVHFLPKRDNAKVRLTIKDKVANLVHSKIYVVDSKAMISYANLTYSGMKKNYETLVIFEKESVVESIAKTYEELER